MGGGRALRRTRKAACRWAAPLGHRARGPGTRGEGGGPSSWWLQVTRMKTPLAFCLCLCGGRAAVWGCLCSVRDTGEGDAETRQPGPLDSES